MPTTLVVVKDSLLVNKVLSIFGIPVLDFFSLVK
jgi:hypothetical protein